MLVLSGRTEGRFRASQLSEMSLFYFHVEPDRLMGLLTLAEQGYFKAAGTGGESAARIFPPHHPVAIRFKDLCTLHGANLSFRLQLLLLFAEVGSEGLLQNVPEPAAQADAKERLRALFSQTPASALLELSFSELARRAGCTPRHLSRIFGELAGMSFREKQVETRLARATELLATTEAKMVDVALESGYQSLSLFNTMFKRRFGLSPGRWRRMHNANPASVQRRNDRKLPAWFTDDLSSRFVPRARLNDAALP
jgi:AraC-like DNA-binding protein